MVISLLCQRIQFSIVVQCCTPFMLAGCCIYLTVSSGSGRERQQRVHKASAPMVWLDMQETIFLVRGNELCLPHHSGRKRGLWKKKKKRADPNTSCLTVTTELMGLFSQRRCFASPGYTWRPWFLSRNPSQGCFKETMLGRDTSCNASRSKANPVCPPGHSAKDVFAEHGVGDDLWDLSPYFCISNLK